MNIMRMRLFFTPAIALMNRLGYTKKFALLWLMSLGAIAVVVYSLYASLDKDIHTSRRELEGLALIKPIFQTVQLMQQLRGLSSAFLGGRKSMRDWRAAKEKETAGAFNAMEGKLPPDLTSSADWHSIKASWAQLQKEGLTWTAEENFAAHTRLIRQILLFQVFAADEYALTLDFEIGSFYMINTSVSKLPEALEYLGQIRAYSIVLLSEKRASERQKVKIITLAAQLDETLKALKVNIEKAGQRNPMMQAPLLAAFEAIADSAGQIIGIVQSDIFTGHFVTTPEDFYTKASTAIDHGYAQMYELLLPTTEALIKGRIARAEVQLRTSIGIALLLILVVAYFAAGIYYAISHSIQSLARSAHTLASGDMRERIDLGTRDELKQVGDSFNEMAEGFSVLLEQSKKAEAALRESEMFNRSLVEHLPQRIFIKDRNSVYLTCNKNFAHDFGLTPEQFVGKDDFAYNPPDLARAYRADDQEVMASGTLKDIEEPYKLAGELRWAHTIKVPYHDANGQIIGVLGIFEDITGRKQSEETIRQSESRYRFLFDNMLEGFAHCRMLYDNNQPNDFIYLDVNAAFEPLTGLTNVIGKKVSELIPGILEANPELFEIYERVTVGGKPEKFETYIAALDIWLSLSVYSAEAECFIAVFDNITERKLTDRALIESSEKLNSVIETALDAVVQMDAEGIISGWNKQAEKTFGWTKEEAIGRVLGETIIPLQYRDAHMQGLKRFPTSDVRTLLNSQVEMLGLHRDGHEFPIELSITAGKTAGKYEYNGFIRDITNRKKSEELIWKQANFDVLTGLPNRRMFHDRLEQEIRKLHRSRLPLALLFLDLDKFKETNDTLGHNMGDTLLIEAARRIGACVRESDTVARLGGDEFTVILSELDDTRRVDMLAQNILHALALPFQLGNETAHLSASIGITLYPNDAAEAGEMLKNADQAMYAAKNAGGNRFSYFTPSMQQTALTRLHLISDLRGALADDQFRVYFQPIVELATGRIHKAEALIRWQHPKRGMISPAEFIPLAEETGLIIKIGDWVFKESAQQVKRWRSLYNPEFQISVNESPVQFRSDSSLHGKWPDYLQELELPGQSMVIEITEGLLLNAESGVMDKLLQFNNAGIQISLDDFGTGYSSLSYLQMFDLDYLKIDQSFTRNLAPGSGSMALSEAIIVMAHKLGMKVIAEGVETEQQRDLLSAAGCDYGQGYLFSRPVPPEEFEKLLAI